MNRRLYEARQDLIDARAEYLKAKKICSSEDYETPSDIGRGNGATLDVRNSSRPRTKEELYINVPKTHRSLAYGM